MKQLQYLKIQIPMTKKIPIFTEFNVYPSLKLKINLAFRRKYVLVRLKAEQGIDYYLTAAHGRLYRSYKMSRTLFNKLI